MKKLVYYLDCQSCLRLEQNRLEQKKYKLTIARIRALQCLYRQNTSRGLSPNFCELHSSVVESVGTFCCLCLTFICLHCFPFPFPLP
jgi:hypothetical protein